MDKPVLVRFITLAIAVTLVVSAFFIGRSSVDRNVDEGLISELQTLRDAQADATVEKRVSQQMEDIAYQQKAVSDEQRERAEQQSVLANEMRLRAESESRLAKESEKKATEALEEAEKQRARALEHQKMAEIQRDEATHARQIADTLHYRTVGRTLCNSAITQYEGGNHQLASQLAYAGWNFLNRYEGNTYEPEAFESLRICSESSSTVRTKKGGSVTASFPIPGDGAVVVTSYGEIEIHRALGLRRKSIFYDNSYDFRGVWADSTTIYALCLHGPICLFKENKQVSFIELPYDSYNFITELEGGKLIVSSQRSLLILDRLKETVERTIELQKDLSTFVVDSHGILLFFNDGTAGRVSPSFRIEPSSTSFGNGRVMTAFYDPCLNALAVGCEDGNVYLFNDIEEKCVCTIYGHQSMVTSISFAGPILVTGSYDRTVLIWNLPLFRFSSGKNLAAELGVEERITGNDSRNTTGEWITPASCTYESWPFSVVSLNNTQVLVGCGNGDVQILNVSDLYMSGKIRSKMEGNMSREDWDHYVGTSIPYENF